MSLLQEILSELNILTESVEINDINDAIKSMRSAKIVYDDEEGGDGKGERIICPVAYGLSTKGNPVVRAFQKQGSTKRGAPQWKLFKVSCIKNWETDTNTIYNPSELIGFNKEGDKQMEIIYSIAPIGNAKQISISKAQGTPEKLTPGPVTKGIINKSGKEKEQEKQPEKKETVDNKHYTANNAINDILTTAKNIEQKDSEEKVDKTTGKDYINNDKLNAPETEPITQKEIPGGDKPVDSNNDSSEKVGKTLTDDPISKEDLEKDELDKEKDDFKKSYDDMMKRMDNVNNDDNEENED